MSARGLLRSCMVDFSDSFDDLVSMLLGLSPWISKKQVLLVQLGITHNLRARLADGFLILHKYREQYPNIKPMGDFPRAYS
jgi:hypothetical protein